MTALWAWLGNSTLGRWLGGVGAALAVIWFAYLRGRSDAGHNAKRKDAENALAIHRDADEALRRYDGDTRPVDERLRQYDRLRD